MKPIYGIVAMVIFVILLSLIIAAFTHELQNEKRETDIRTVATPVNNDDDYSRQDSSYHLTTQCSDGVVCYNIGGDAMWCTRDCDLVTKRCPKYRGSCNRCNGMIIP